MLMALIRNDHFTQQFIHCLSNHQFHQKMSKINLVFTDYITIICALVIAFLLSDYTKLKENISNEAKLLNNTQHANQSFIIFNRVPKAGSETLWGLLDRLQFGNKFSSYR